MSQQGYNGWSNYPTWAVNLWLSSDEGLYTETLERARFASRQADPTNGLASSLKDWVSDDLAPDLGATFAADLLGYALGEVEWYEIAAAWLEDVEPDEDETQELDFDAAYRVDGYNGVAWRLLGYEMTRDEDYEWSGLEIENRERVRAVMVGDDRVFTFDVDEVEAIEEDDYCHECGQIGCGHTLSA